MRTLKISIIIVFLLTLVSCDYSISNSNNNKPTNEEEGFYYGLLNSSERSMDSVFIAQGNKCGDGGLVLNDTTGIKNILGDVYSIGYAGYPYRLICINLPDSLMGVNEKNIKIKFRAPTIEEIEIATVDCTIIPFIPLAPYIFITEIYSNYED